MALPLPPLLSSLCSPSLTGSGHIATGSIFGPSSFAQQQSSQQQAMSSFGFSGLLDRVGVKDHEQYIPFYDRLRKEIDDWIKLN